MRDIQKRRSYPFAVLVKFSNTVNDIAYCCAPFDEAIRNERIAKSSRQNCYRKVEWRDEIVKVGPEQNETYNWARHKRSSIEPVREMIEYGCLRMSSATKALGFESPPSKRNQVQT